MSSTNHLLEQKLAEIESKGIQATVAGTTTYEAISNGAKLAPEKTAITYFLNGNFYDKSKIPNSAWLPPGSRHKFSVPYREVSFAELLTGVNQTANTLHEFGVRKEDVVSILLPNFVETHYALWGAEAAGIANPINPLLEADIIADIMNAAETKVLITLGPVPGTEIWEKVSRIQDRVPGLEKVLVLFSETNEAQNIYDFHTEILKRPGNNLISGRQIEPSDPASMFHTGGTTGTPKLAVHSHANEVANASMLAIGTDTTADDAVLVGLPLFHVNAAIGTGLMPLSLGASIVLAGPSGFRTEGVVPNFFAMLQHFGITFFSAVPTAYSALLNQSCEGMDFSKVRFAISGAAPMPVAVFNAFRDKTGIHLLEGYGLTEGTCVSSLTPLADSPKVGSIGKRLPFSQMRVALFDHNDEFIRDALPNEVGAVLIAGPNVFHGYLESRHNQGLWVELDKQKWLRTGDMGRQDEDGVFWLTGRKKELIIRGGHNIDPKMIEEAIASFKGVETVAAVGRPDKYAGELPVVYVSLIDKTITPEALLSHAEQKISERAAIPKEVIIVDKIPLTAVGKVFKPELVWRESQRVAERALQSLFEKYFKGMLQPVFKVIVEMDELHGYVVSVSLPSDTSSEVKSLVKQEMEKYSFHHEIN